MAKMKTFRLTDDQSAWLAAESERVRLSEQRIVEALIDNARVFGWAMNIPQTSDQP